MAGFRGNWVSNCAECGAPLYQDDEWAGLSLHYCRPQFGTPIQQNQDSTVRVFEIGGETPLEEFKRIKRKIESALQELEDLKKRLAAPPPRPPPDEEDDWC
jgi:hypothetical protein